MIEVVTEDSNEDDILAEAFFCFDKNNNLVVYFDNDRSATMELSRQEEVDVVKAFLSDPNLWANFFGSLSAALKEHM